MNTWTLKWPRYFYSRWCPRGGGVPRDPTVENHFPSRILQWNLHHAPYMYGLWKITILPKKKNKTKQKKTNKQTKKKKKKKLKQKQNKKKWKCCTVSKWRPNNRFLFRVISILAKIWKTTFPKEFFNEIWLTVGEHEYIYIKVENH